MYSPVTGPRMTIILSQARLKLSQKAGPMCRNTENNAFHAK